MIFYMSLHINLICLKCGNIADSDDATVKEITRNVAATKFKPTDQRMDVYGILPKKAMELNKKK